MMLLNQLIRLAHETEEDRLIRKSHRHAPALGPLPVLSGRIAAESVSLEMKWLRAIFSASEQYLFFIHIMAYTRYDGPRIRVSGGLWKDPTAKHTP